MDPALHAGLIGDLSAGTLSDKTPMELCSLIKKIAHNYTLKKSTLYKEDESRQGTLGGRQHRNRHTVISHQHLRQLPNQLHNHPLSGHQGQDNPYQKVSEYYYWP